MPPTGNHAQWGCSWLHGPRVLGPGCIWSGTWAERSWACSIQLPHLAIGLVMLHWKCRHTSLECDLCSTAHLSCCWQDDGVAKGTVFQFLSPLFAGSSLQLEPGMNNWEGENYREGWVLQVLPWRSFKTSGNLPHSLETLGFQRCHHQPSAVLLRYYLAAERRLKETGRSPSPMVAPDFAHTLCLLQQNHWWYSAREV